MEKKKFPVKAEINVDLTQQDIDDIMVAALEGGIDYWCFKAEVIGDYLGEYASRADQPGRDAEALRHGKRGEVLARPGKVPEGLSALD